MATRELAGLKLLIAHQTRLLAVHIYCGAEDIKAGLASARTHRLKRLPRRFE